ERVLGRRLERTHRLGVVAGLVERGKKIVEEAFGPPARAPQPPERRVDDGPGEPGPEARGGAEGGHGAGAVAGGPPPDARGRPPRGERAGAGGRAGGRGGGGRGARPPPRRGPAGARRASARRAPASARWWWTSSWPASFELRRDEGRRVRKRHPPTPELAQE